MIDALGLEICRVESREHEGKPALVGVAIRTYDTTVEDLWEALTTPARLVRWFLPVEGDLKVGGRYQLIGNAGGTITRCEPPTALDLTWEFAGGTSWVRVRLAPEGARAKLTLEHIAHTDGIGEEHLETYGPGATGVGWDLALHGLRHHLTSEGEALDPAAFQAWTRSPEGKAFVRARGEAWAEAYVASGAEPERARAQAERTIAFYTGA
jgi:uncharacterized protein YndB with AHSA1/START domain